MNVGSAKGDVVGNTVGFVIGVLVGLLVAAPAFANGVDISIGTTTFDPAGTAVVVGAFAMIFVPIVVFALYVVFATAE